MTDSQAGGPQALEKLSVALGRLARSDREAPFVATFRTLEQADQCVRPGRVGVHRS